MSWRLLVSHETAGPPTSTLASRAAEGCQRGPFPSIAILSFPSPSGMGQGDWGNSAWSRGPPEASGHLSHSFPKTLGHCCSEDGHLLAHPGVPHRMCVQTRVPAQGLTIYARQKHIHAGHRHGEQGGVSSWETEGREPRHVHKSSCSCLAREAAMVQGGLPESSGGRSV